MKFTVTAEETGKRLDHILTEKLAPLTRSQVKRLVQSGVVTINGKPATVHQFLKMNDEVEAQQITVPPRVKPVAEAQKIEPTPDPVVLFEDEDYIVLDKPVGLLVHPTAKNEPNTLMDWLRSHYPPIKEVGDNTYRGGIIHRLDKDVSGVMVVAKNTASFEDLKHQFKHRTVQKEYRAIVYGAMTQHEGEINLPIGRNADGQFVAHPLNDGEAFHENDKVAKTRYFVLEYLQDLSLLRVDILTGRTHQIRAHLHAIGHPIVGDQIYKPRKTVFTLLRRRIKVIEPGRICLHATTIGFTNRAGLWVEHSSPIPTVFTTLINARKKST